CGVDVAPRRSVGVVDASVPRRRSPFLHRRRDRGHPRGSRPRPSALQELGHHPVGAREATVSTGGISLVAFAIAVGLVGIVVPLLPGTLLVFGAIAVWAAI